MNTPPAPGSLRHLGIPALLVVLSLIGGCADLQGGKLLAPERFGQVPVTANLYVERGADDATRTRLRTAMMQAESAVRAAYGSVTSQPVVHACISSACYEAFGGRGSRAKTYGNRILLSPRGLNWHYLAHEWSHAEMLSRLTLIAWLRLPQWFDEGVAVAVSEAPEHAETHWAYLVAIDAPRPTRSELHALKSLRQWLDAVHRYGENANIERKAKGQPEIRPVYTAAGHELRPWLAEVGSQGLLALLERLNRGEKFEVIYPTNSRGLGQE